MPVVNCGRGGCGQGANCGGGLAGKIVVETE